MKTEIDDDTKYAKVDRMEALFSNAFADAFDVSKGEAANVVSFFMGELEALGVISEIMEEYPVAKDDLIRLGYIGDPVDNANGTVEKTTDDVLKEESQSPTWDANTGNLFPPEN